MPSVECKLCIVVHSSQILVKVEYINFSHTTGILTSGRDLNLLHRYVCTFNTRIGFLYYPLWMCSSKHVKVYHNHVGDILLMRRYYFCVLM